MLHSLKDLHHRVWFGSQSAQWSPTDWRSMANPGTKPSRNTTVALTTTNGWFSITISLFRVQSYHLECYGLGEQMPGLYHFEDVTGVLVRKGYWASYNVPYFKDVFVVSGYDDRVRTNGSWYSHSDTPRAKIFARDQGNVKDMETFMKLMRSNNYKHDPYAACNCTPPYSASGAIAARKDLNPRDGYGPQTSLPYGAIDAKITNFSMFRKYLFTAVEGPTRGTNDVLPVFKWSDSGYNISHYLQPDVFDFAPITTKWVFVGDDDINRKSDENKEEDVFAGYDNNIPLD
ncbi:putative phospholipase B-like 1 [Nilaparvata lugens]|uniref:putative phospholipase B-like 1 n=1 Tax=Nilaparvata lugens TaxID=108931 RepID=UPI00193E6AC5|nr:putative phospholipase B-like 1 [Nilaparvata lugens]